MKGRRLLIAGGALLLLTAVWFFGEAGPGAKEKRLFDFAPEAVRGVTLERPDAPVIGVERKGGGWHLVRPIETLADQGEVEGIIAAAASAPIEKRLGVVDDLKPFGLDRPVTVSFLLTNGAKYTARIGDMTPDKSLRYIGVGEGNEVVAVARSVGARLYRNQFELRDKLLLGLTTEVIDKIKVDGDHPTIVERTESGWMIRSPYQTPASLPPVAATLAILVNLRASGFYDTPDDIDDALPPSTRAIHIWVDGKEKVFHVGESRRGSPIVIVDQVVARIAPDLFAALPKGPEDFLDLRLLPGAEAKPAQIDYRIGQQSVSLTREGERWRLVQPVADDADQAVVESLLHHLAETEGESLVAGPGFDPTMFGLLNPYAVARVTDETGTVRSLKIGKKGSDYFVTATGWNGVATIDADQVDTLFPAIPPVDRRFFRIEAVGVKKVVVERLGQRFVVLSAQQGGVMTEPKKRPLKDESYYRFLWGILGLGYAGASLEKGPLGEPVMTIEVWGVGEKPVNRVSLYKPLNTTEGYRAVDRFHQHPVRIDGRLMTTDMVTLLETLMESVDE